MSVEVFCEGDLVVVSCGGGGGSVVWIGDQLDGSPLSFISNHLQPSGTNRLDSVAKTLSRETHRLGDHGARKLGSARKAWLSNRPQSSSFPSGLSESQAIDLPSFYCKCTLQHARTLPNTHVHSCVFVRTLQ